MSHITLNTTIHEIFHHPEIGALNQYLIYCLDRDLWLNECKCHHGSAAYGSKGD